VEYSPSDSNVALTGTGELVEKNCLYSSSALSLFDVAIFTDLYDCVVYRDGMHVLPLLLDGLDI
jgi:hypothetical protein